MRKFLSSHLKPKPAIKEKIKKPHKKKESLYARIDNHYIPKKILAEQEKTREIERLNALNAQQNPNKHPSTRAYIEAEKKRVLEVTKEAREELAKRQAIAIFAAFKADVAKLKSSMDETDRRIATTEAVRRVLLDED